MVVYVKNRRLKKKVFRELNRYQNIAIRAYNKGHMKRGLKYETLADKLYARNYKRIFGVRK